MSILLVCAPQDHLVPISELRVAAFLSFIIGATVGVVISALLLLSRNEN
jgi:hypothetical protein